MVACPKSRTPGKEISLVIKAQGRLMKKHASVALSLLVSFILTACGSIPPTYYYRVHYPVHSSNNRSPHLLKTLAVAQFSADVLYQGDKIVFRASPYEAQFYHYRRWVAPPKKIVTEKVVRQYRQASLFEKVVRIPSTVPIDYVLKGHIQAFEEWDESSSWYGIVTIEFALHEANSDSIVWEKVITERTPAGKKEPVEVVKAISESLNKVVTRSIADIREALKASKTVERNN